MRHLGSIGFLAMIGTLALPSVDASAAPLDFLFGEPPLASRPAYRLKRRPAPALTQGIPLPVPRPRFADDPAPDERATEPPHASKPLIPKPADTPPAVARPAIVVPPTLAAPSEPKGMSRSPNAADPARLAPKTEEPATLAAPAPPTSNPVGAPARATVPEPPAKPADLSTKPDAAVPQDPSPSAAAGPSAPPTPPPRPADLAVPPVPGKLEPVTPEPARSAPVSPGPAKPEPSKPAVAPSGATLAFTPRAPDDDPQCPSRLMSQKVGIEQTTLGPQPDARCTVVQPVHLLDVTMPDGSKVDFPEHPTIACVTADSFSSYVRDMLSPLAKGTFGAPVTAVWTGPGLECRSRDHIFGAKLSAHGQGLAIDIAKLKLADGRVIEVGTPTTDAETAFETAARAGACGYFHTVLGPGSDAYHRTHWHFDLEVRGAHGDSKYCK